MGILTWMVIGLVVGLVASSVSKSSCLRRVALILVSLFGALVGWLNVAYLYRVPGAVFTLNWIVALAALIGAFLTVVLYNIVSPQKPRQSKQIAR